MKYFPSPLYEKSLEKRSSRLLEAVTRGLAEGPGSAKIFFRADDIGVPSQLFTEMIRLFTKYSTPLCLATVPTWLTPPRLDSLLQTTGTSDLFCYHQHGWMHTNHEKVGKKYEFGKSRSSSQLAHDILGGKSRLEQLLGDQFYPAFTPPWNRCDSRTLEILEEHDFHAVSRSKGASPIATGKLKDFQVSVDLHTRKEENPQISFSNLCDELQHSISIGFSGVMLHHQRMNEHALELLEDLLKICHDIKELKKHDFRSLVS